MAKARSATLTLLAFGWASAAFSEAPPVPAVRERLANGLILIAQKASRTQLTVGLIAYRVGTRYDPPGKTGLTHLLEHMLLRSPTASYPAREAEAALLANGPTHVPGLDCNAETLTDVFHVYAVTKPDGVDTLLKVFAEQMRTARFDPALLRDEKERALQELRTVQSNPAAVLYHSTLATAFTRHPYRFPRSGLPEGLHASTLEDLRAHYDRYCRPDNAVLVLFGGGDPAVLMRKAKACFEAIPASGAIPSPPAGMEPEQTQPRRTDLTLSVDHAELMVAWRTAPPGAPSKAALQLIAGHLQQVLFQRLVAPGTASFVSVQDDLLAPEGGLFLVHAAAAPGKPLDTLLTRIRHAVAEVRENGLPEPSLSSLRTSLGAGLQRLDPDLEQGLRGAPDPVPALVQFAATRARLELALAPWHAQFLEALQAITADEIRAAAALYLADERSNVVVLEPKEK